MLGILLLSNIAPQIIHCGVNKPSRLAKSQELLGHLTNEDPVPPQYSIPDSSNTPTTETYAPRITKVWTRIFHMRPHSIGETRFLFTICEKLIFEKKLESPLILFLFLKGK